MEKVKRIEWVDYYKALAIILVVLGHTGQFNEYIYQFHVAAFFFISGVVAGLEKRRLEEIIILKFFTLILPYIFFAVWGLTIFALLQQFGVLRYVSMWDSIPGWLSNMTHIFQVPYCDWLGAMWFLTTLFVVTIIAKLCLLADSNKCGIIFLTATMFLYLMGYYYHEMGYSPTFINKTDHFLIVQVYFSLGIAFRWAYDHVKLRIPKPVVPLLFAISAVVLWLFRNRGYTMDLAETIVNSSKSDLLMACNGIVFLLCLSIMIGFIPVEWFKKAVQYLGQNTFGILIFHFVGFKLVTLCLYLFGFCNIEEMAKLVPPAELTNTFWPLYLIVSIAFSLSVWASINRSRIVRLFTGLSRGSYKKIYDRYKGLYQSGKTI